MRSARFIALEESARPFSTDANLLRCQKRTDLYLGVGWSPGFEKGLLIKRQDGNLFCGKMGRLLVTLGCMAG